MAKQLITCTIKNLYVTEGCFSIFRKLVSKLKKERLLSDRKDRLNKIFKSIGLSGKTQTNRPLLVEDTSYSTENLEKYESIEKKAARMSTLSERTLTVATGIRKVG